MVRVLAILALVACKNTPSAPEGLGDVSRHVVRHYFDDDAMFAAGVQGFLTSMQSDGDTLLSDKDNALTIDDLEPGDIAHLPLPSTLLADAAKDESIDRDPTEAAGVAAVSRIPCDLDAVANTLLRGDQDVVFPDDWAAFDRTAITDEDRFRQARRDGVYHAFSEPFDPYDALPEGGESSIWLTTNVADPPSLLSGIVDIDPFEVRIDFRQGIFETEEGPVEVLAMLSWMPEAAWGEAESNALLQNYTVELNVAQDDEVLRLFTVWAHPLSKIAPMPADADLPLQQLSLRARRTHERLAVVCAE